MEAFLHSSAAQQQQSQTAATWLLEQQRLAQEAADAEQQLTAWLASGSAAAAALLQGPAGAGQPASEESLPAAAAGACDDALAEAGALAATAAGLLMGRGAARARLADLRQRMAAALESAEAQAAALQGAANELLGQAQAASAAATSAVPVEPAGSLAEQVRQLCGQYPLAPPECLAQLCGQAAELQARHEKQRQQRRAAWRSFLDATRRQQAAGSACSEPQQADRCSSSSRGSSLTGDSSWAGDGAAAGACSVLGLAGSTADGWSAEHHAVYLHARNASGGDGTAGSGALARHVAALLPCRTPDAVAAHARWHKEAARLQAAAQQGEAGAREETAAFLRAAADVLAEAEAECLADGEAALQQLEAAAAGLQACGALQQQRDDRAALAAERGLAALQAAAAAAAQRQSKRREVQHWRGRMREGLERRRAQQAAEAAAAREAERAAEAAAAQQALAAAAAGRARVEQRAQRDAAKQAARQEREAQRQQEHERRAAALDRVRAQVAPAVERDASRAQAPTQSSAAAVASERQQHGLFAQACLGFTTDALLADRRFKVFEALRAAGLHATAAGRAAAAAAGPGRAPRPDMLSSEQRGACN